MNLINAICCVLLARTSELGLANNQGMLRRRLATATDANRFIDSAIQELTLSGVDFCKCAEQTVAQTPPDSDDIPDATSRRRSLLDRIKKRIL